MFTQAKPPDHAGSFLDDDDRWRGERPWPASAENPENDEAHFPRPKRMVSMRLARRETLIVIGGMIGILLLATLLALLTRASGTAVVLATLFLMAFIAFATLPVWAAAMLDDIEDHKSELEDDDVEAPARR
jgi:hypothetical protein